MASLTLNHCPATDQQDDHKPTLILLHGGALSGRMFKDLVPLLSSQGYEVYAPDLPGHGSSVAAGPFTFTRATELMTQAIDGIRSQSSRKIVLVRVSLGGQVVLDIIQHNGNRLVDAALVAGVSIRPPDEDARWEMPHMPSDEKWIQIMTEDVNVMGMENAKGVQEESFRFIFSPPPSLPPVLVVVGEQDVAMARRDFKHLGQLVNTVNERCKSMTLENAWHNHPIDIPERFAGLVVTWTQDALEST